MHYAIVDIETTGGDSRFEKITEIAVLIHDGEKIVREYSTLLNPEKSIPYYITNLTGITNEMVADAPKFYEIAKELVELTEGKTIVAHNAHFDYAFIRQEFKSLGYHFHRGLLCTVKLSRKLIPGFSSYSLGTLCRYLGIENESRHRAQGDAHATAKLFELLHQRDDNGVIFNSIRNNPALLKLPPNLDKENLDRLPEETGIYYFHNEKGNIIYVGKSTNIRKRVLSHFSAKDGIKASSMKEQITSITYEHTGNELIALLLESDEIKKHKPKFNRAQKESHYAYGIYKSLTDKGYYKFEISRIVSRDEEPLLAVKSVQTGLEIIGDYCSRFFLCQKLCGLYDISHACLAHSSGQCKGACVGQESPEDYNNRVLRLIRKWRFENQSFFIVGEGRTNREKSVVAIEQGRYLGFGYIDADFQVTSPEQLKLFITKYQDNSDVQGIIRKYLEKKRDKVISF